MLTDDSISALKSGYQVSHPFPFIVIDDFLQKDKIHEILYKVSLLDSNNADFKFVGSPHEHLKFAFQSTHHFDLSLKSLFDFLVGDEFVSYIESLTGIHGIIRYDSSLAGAGVHRIHSDGYLGIHTDFNSFQHHSLGTLDRRINLLLYLNPNWKDEYNGHLLLCDNESKTIPYKIAPILNRCVIFNTCKNSLHGHPVPLNTPEDIYRNSIAVYYYTKNTTPGVDFEGDPPHSTIWHSFPDIDQKN